jgi:hypothetical protein
MDVILPLLELGLVGTLVFATLTRRMSEEERGWIMRILMFAFLARLLAATVFAMVPGTRIFHDDADGYEMYGMHLAERWHGNGPPVHHPHANNYGFFYVSGAVYFVFGTFRAATSYFNCLLGTINIFLVYRLARRFFHVLVARRAALLLAFIPSMILWSALALKDTLTTMLIILALSSCVRLKDEMTPKNMILTLLPMVAIQPLRFYMLYFLMLAVIGSLMFERGSKLITGVPKTLIIGAGVMVLLVAVGLSGSAGSGTQFLDLEKVSSFRQGMAETANSGFAKDADVSTPLGALTFLPIGMAFLLLSPFPWQFTSLRSAFAAPETIMWWFMFPAMLRGLRYTMGKRFAAMSPVILFTFALVPAYSLIHGNVGSGFRQRAQIFVFLFIFTAVGQYAKKLQRAGRSPDLLLTDVAQPAPAQPAPPRVEAA